MINDTCFYLFLPTTYNLPTIYNRHCVTAQNLLTQSFIVLCHWKFEISDILFTERTGTSRAQSSGQAQRVKDVATESSSCST